MKSRRPPPTARAESSSAPPTTPSTTARTAPTADLDLMKAAGFTVIRVGESVWSTWEPRDGEFDLDWLQPVLDGAHERGIARHPRHAHLRGAAVAADGVPRDRRRAAHGRADAVGRAPGGRLLAPGVPLPRRARHPRHPRALRRPPRRHRLPGRQRAGPASSSTTTAASTRFVRRLKAQYGDVETLNREWGLTYWSHRLDGLVASCGAPTATRFPQYDLAWRRYQADLTTEFIAWQADLVRRVPRGPASSSPPASRTRGPRSTTRSSSSALDITAGNPYYGMQDHLDATLELAARDAWTTTGVAGLLPPGRPHVLLEAGAVPRHRDQRPVDRRRRRSTSRPTRASSSRRPSRSSRAARR